MGLFSLDVEALLAELPFEIITDRLTVAGGDITALTVQRHLLFLNSLLDHFVHHHIHFAAFEVHTTPKVLVVLVAATRGFFDACNGKWHSKHRRRNNTDGGIRLLFHNGKGDSHGYFL